MNLWEKISFHCSQNRCASCKVRSVCTIEGFPIPHYWTKKNHPDEKMLKEMLGAIKL